ncbi:unnamed protein product [Discula destructiva]
MCIVLLTTAHPKYALIALDNRDEFILRPTSRPHWWTTSPDTPTHAQNGAAAAEPQHILSSRDLHRAEQGTWLGITRAGHFAVLTNYREIDPVSGAPSVMGAKSRGGMVTAWLDAPQDQSVAAFVESMIAEGGTQGVGGFSLICGKLRRKRRPGEASGPGEMAPLAILSNKAAHPEQIPWIAGERGQTVGLSNAAWDGPVEWPKVTKGKALLEETVAEAVEKGWSEDKLEEALFGLLDKDDLPKSSDMKFEDYFKVLHESIFIPLVGNQENQDAMVKAAAQAEGNGHADAGLKKMVGEVDSERRSGTPQPFNSGMYGTQRQTVMLVDWDGNITFTERALFDEHGKAIERGKGDVTYRFAVEGWDQS